MNIKRKKVCVLEFVILQKHFQNFLCSYLLMMEIAAMNRLSTSPNGTYPRTIPAVPSRDTVSITSWTTGTATAPITIVATIIPIPLSTSDVPFMDLNLFLSVFRSIVKY